MSIILYPSQEVHVINIPEPDDLVAEFNYKYFQVDESISDIADSKGDFEKVRFDQRDSSYVKSASSRVSRFITLAFKSAKINSNSQAQNEIAISTTNKSTGDNVGLIVKNLSKIMSEDDFANSNFTSLSFYDGSLSKKMYAITSGTISNLSSGNEVDNLSLFRGARWLEAMTPSDIDPEILYDSYVQPILGLNILNAESAGQEQQQGSLSDVNNAKVSVQINNKIFADLLKNAATDQFNLNKDDLLSNELMRNAVSNASVRTELVSPNDEDYKSVLSYIDLIPISGYATNIKNAKIIGYIIDKYEVTSNGDLTRHQPIILENSNTTETVDLKVKYGSCYMYTVRSVAELMVPAYDDEENKMYLAKILVSSRETAPVYVTCIEQVIPPSPVDLMFVWDYDRTNVLTERLGSLMISWSFPINMQRDIKRFQVFRRSNVNLPFELIKEYDFDDSLQKYNNNEEPDPRSVTRLNSPRTYFYDDDFKKTSTFIYTVCSVDAHGYVSTYGEQFEVSFDVFKNKLVKKLISHTGAPRQYPNLYIENDLFVDMMNVSGEHSKIMNVYFNPEYVGYTTDDDKYVKAFYTAQDNASYILQVINVDNQKQQEIKIVIDDPQNLTNNPQRTHVRAGRPRGL